MGSTTTSLVEHVITALRAREVELRDADIHRLSLSGSVARDDEGVDSA